MPKTAHDSQNTRLAQSVAQSIYWETFFKLDSMPELSGEEVGRIATLAEQLVERELIKLLK